MTDPEIILPSQAEATIPTPPPNTIFRGPNGLRAGWRVLLFIVFTILIGFAVVAPFAILRTLHKGSGVEVHRSFGLTPLDLGMSEALIFFCTAVAAWIMARIEHRKWGQYGLPWQRAFQKDFWIGAVVGFAAISASLLLIFAFHGFSLTGMATRGSTLVAATAAWFATFVLVGLAEEFAFRGYMQFTLTTGMGFWPAAVLLSVSFAAAHAGNPGESVPGLLSIIVFALLFCLFLRRRGNLWWAVGFHMGWDWGQTFFYGVPDSGIPAYHNFLGSTFHGPTWLTGGTVGPEASIFTPIVLIVVGIIFAQFYRKNLYSTAGVGRRTADLRPRTSDLGPSTPAI